MNMGNVKRDLINRYHIYSIKMHAAEIKLKM